MSSLSVFWRLSDSMYVSEIYKDRNPAEPLVWGCECRSPHGMGLKE